MEGYLSDPVWGTLGASWIQTPPGKKEDDHPTRCGRPGPVILNVHPLSGVKGSGFDCNYRTALLGTLLPSAAVEASPGRKNKIPYLSAILPPSMKPQRRRWPGGKNQSQGPFEGPGPGPRLHGPTMGTSGPGQQTPQTFLQQRQHGWHTELSLPRGSPSPSPAHPPGEAQMFQNWKLLRNTKMMFFRAI